MKVDVIVVGARCAGAATGMLLARAGARVLIVDKGGYGTDTLSTHALMRGAVLQLHRWVVLPRIVAAGTPPIRSTTFSYPSQDVTVAIEERFGVEALYAPRRVLLDRVLVDAAVESGADVAHGVRVDDLVVDGRGRVRGVKVARNGSLLEIDADMVVGADGLYSTVARLAGARPILEGHHAAGCLFSYWRGLPVDGYYWRYARPAYLAAIPTNDEAVCLVASVPAARFRTDIHGDPVAAYLRWIREAAPAFDTLLTDATRVEGVRGFGGHTGFIRQSSGPGWALVGDAGYFKDPSTAHGITDALRDAELLARAIVQGTDSALSAYESTRLDLSRGLFEATDESASFGWTDVDHLQAQHRAFSREMSREVRALAALEPLPWTSPSASVPLVV